MYKIKPKQNYNIVIRDLGLNLRSSHDNWVYLNKKDFDSSTDAQAVKSFLIIEEVDSVEPVAAEKKVADNVVQVSENAFVKDGRIDTNPAGIFVTQPPEDEVKVEEKAEVVEEVKIETVEEKVEKVEKVEEIPAEVTTEEAPKETKKANRKTKR
jgi:hypothetical protein